MAVLEIRKYPEEILKRPTAPVQRFDDHLQDLIDSMIETMYAAPGVGLAAPQVGVSNRLAVIDVSARGEESPLLVIVNPEIVNTEGIIEFEEGCLSVPEYTAKVQRAAKVVVTAFDREGRPIEIEGEGLLAIALQHEIDHLNGTLFVDRLSTIKREFFKKRFKKALRAGK